MNKIKCILTLFAFSFCYLLASEESVVIDRKRPRDEESTQIYADATVDVAFKEMMWKGDNDPVAKSFIQTFVPDVQVETLEIIKTEPQAIPALKQRGKKQTFMDFHVKAKDGHHYIIEMQSQRHVRFDERALFYTCSTYSRQLDERAFADESWYRHLKPVIAIQVVDYDTNRSQGIKVKTIDEKGEEIKVVDLDDRSFVERVKASPLAQGQAEKHYLMTDRHSGQRLDHLQMIQIELPRYKISSFPQAGEQSTDKDWWIRVLRFSEDYHEKDIAVMPDFAKQALQRLDYTKWAPRLMQEYKESLNDRTAYSTVLQVERAEGKAEGKAETAKQMKDDGLSLEFISKYTKLSLEYLETL
ncbi:MAG: hypothetical protein HEEMFOPI_01413 [Holosporales bacterium]